MKYPSYVTHHSNVVSNKVQWFTETGRQCFACLENAKKTLEGGLCLPLIMIYTTKITKIHLRKIMIKSFVNFPSNV